MSEEKRWYSLRVISGKERKIKERIELEVQRSGWEDFVTQILVPTEKVYKIRNGKKGDFRKKYPSGVYSYRGTAQ